MSRVFGLRKLRPRRRKVIYREAPKPVQFRKTKYFVSQGPSLAAQGIIWRVASYPQVATQVLKSIFEQTKAARARERRQLSTYFIIAFLIVFPGCMLELPRQVVVRPLTAESQVSPICLLTRRNEY